MQRKNFSHMQCPVARSLERVGEWWSILILRDAVYGLKRFDEFQKSLDIAPNMLTRRLNALVKGGLLKRQRAVEAVVHRADAQAVGDDLGADGGREPEDGMHRSYLTGR